MKPLNDSIVPFDKIDKSFKVVKINGISLLDSNISSADYPLTVGLSIKFPAQPFNESLKKTVLDSFKEPDLTNRESGDIVTILMTGVTALTRQVAAKMDQNGILYPAEKIIDILLDADMTHTSNEVPLLKIVVQQDQIQWFFANPSIWSSSNILMQTL